MSDDAAEYAGHDGLNCLREPLAPAVARGLFAALFGGFMWGMFAAMTRIRLDWIPVITVGLAVGLSVRGHAPGRDWRLGVVGALLTIVAGAVAEAWSLWSIVVSQLSMLPQVPFAPSALGAMFADHFRVTNLGAYALAVWEGYHFASKTTWAQRLFDPSSQAQRPRWIAWSVFAVAVLGFVLLFLNVYRAKIAGVAATPAGDRVALAISGYEVSMPQTLSVFSMPQRQRITLDQTRVGFVAWSRDGRLLAVESSPGRNNEPDPGRVTVWDVAAQRPSLLKGGSDFILCLTFSPAEDLLATGCQDGTVHLWDVQAGGSLLALEESYAVQSLAFSRNGQTLAAGLRDGTVVLWDVPGRKRLDAATLHTAAVTGLAFGQRQGREVLFSAGGVDGTLRVWDIAPLQEIEALRQPLGWIAGLSLASNGNSLAVYGGSFHRPGEVRLLNPANGQLQRVLTVHANTVCVAAFAEQGKTLVAGTAAPISPFTSRRDGEVYVWDVATGEPRPPLQ